MADVRRAFAPLGSIARLLLVAVLVEAVLLLVEMALVHAIGQRAIAASMITAPRSSAALAGVAAVLVRITGHVIFPCCCAFALGYAVARRAFVEPHREPLGTARR